MHQYDRIKILGRGSYGVATLVRDRGTGPPGRHEAVQLRVVKEVNLKTMPPEALRETENEVKVLRSLSHRNVVAYYSTFVEDEMLYIVMEYADGGDLSAAIKRRKNESRIFQEHEALLILSQCATALEHIHGNRIVHRDLKSQNIFLTGSGIVKLGDFGIAKVLEHTRAMALTVIGTPTHLPPEVCNNQPYGTKADIWSLGVVFYELLALEQPFQATNLAALIVKIVGAQPKPLSDNHSEEVRKLVEKMLRKDPSRRPSARKVLEASAVKHRTRLASSERPSSGSSLEACTSCGSPATPDNDATRRAAQPAPPAARGDLDALDELMSGLGGEKAQATLSPTDLPQNGRNPKPAGVSARGREPASCGAWSESPSLLDLVRENETRAQLSERSQCRGQPGGGADGPPLLPGKTGRYRRSFSTGDTSAAGAQARSRDPSVESASRPPIPGGASRPTEADGVRLRPSASQTYFAEGEASRGVWVGEEPSFAPGDWSRPAHSQSIETQPVGLRRRSHGLATAERTRAPGGLEPTNLKAALENAAAALGAEAPGHSASSGAGRRRQVGETTPRALSGATTVAPSDVATSSGTATPQPLSPSDGVELSLPAVSFRRPAGRRRHSTEDPPIKELTQAPLQRLPCDDRPILGCGAHEPPSRRRSRGPCKEFVASADGKLTPPNAERCGSVSGPGTRPLSPQPPRRLDALHVLQQARPSAATEDSLTCPNAASFGDALPSSKGLKWLPGVSDVPIARRRRPAELESIGQDASGSPPTPPSSDVAMKVSVRRGSFVLATPTVSPGLGSRCSLTRAPAARRFMGRLKPLGVEERGLELGLGDMPVAHILSLTQEPACCAA